MRKREIFCRCQEYHDYHISILIFYLSSGTSAGFCSGVVFQCSGPMGAILVLPEGGSRVDLQNRERVLRYAAQNGMSWYRFVNGPLGRRVQNGSLYVVTGCDKSPAWGVASYSIPLGDTKFCLKFMTVGSGEDSTSLEYRWEGCHSAAVRTGRQQVRSSEATLGSGEPQARTNMTFNQCAFIRGYRISVQSRLIPMPLDNKVKVEDGINPLALDGVKGGILSGFRSSLSALSRSEVPGLTLECSDSMEAGHDILFEHLSDVSEVSSHLNFLICLQLRVNSTSLTIHWYQSIITFWNQ
jgi:hypothetical protein